MPNKQAQIFFSSVSSKKNTKHLKICIKTWNVLKIYIYIFLNFIFQKIKKRCLWRSAPRLCKWNPIINFVLSKIVGEDRFSAGPPEILYFLCKSFIYVLQKKSTNIVCLEPHDTYVLFRTFFSQVNNNPFFWIGQLP